MSARRVLPIFCFAAAATVMLLVAASADGARHPGLSEHQIQRIALAAAKRAGDPQPGLIQHAAGPRDRANEVASGAIVPDSTWCYLIAERGRFVLNAASPPPGAKPPRGSVLTLVINAKTAAVLDVGVSDHYPDLRKLGSVTTDRRH